MVRVTLGYHQVTNAQHDKSVFHGFYRLEMEQFCHEMGFYINIEAKMYPLIQNYYFSVGVGCILEHKKKVVGLYFM